MEGAAFCICLGLIAGAVAYMRRLIILQCAELQKQIDDLKRELEALKRKE